MNKKIYLLVLLVSYVLIAYVTAPFFPAFFFNFYNQQFYVYLDKILAVFTNLFAFSIGDILYGLVIFFGSYKIVKLFKQKKYKCITLHVFTAMFLFFGIFQLSWGFNNYKYSVFHQLNLERTYTPEQLTLQTNILIEVVNTQHLQLTGDLLKEVVIAKNLNLFNETAKENYTLLPEHLRKILTNNEINNVKPSLFSPVQSYMGFSGYFNPFTHENQVNIEIPTIGMPVTVAHEMAHQLGIASETEANFFGYMVMLQSKDLKFKYAANLYALKYCLKQYKYENEEMYQLLFNRLNVGVQQNIRETEHFWQSKRNISSYFFKHLYGRFLKINNQKDGIQSYNRFVGLLINYNKKYQQI